MNDSLKHVGVIGMHWGRRSGSPSKYPAFSKTAKGPSKYPAFPKTVKDSINKKVSELMPKKLSKLTPRQKSIGKEILFSASYLALMGLSFASLPRSPKDVSSTLRLNPGKKIKYLDLKFNK